MPAIGFEFRVVAIVLGLTGSPDRLGLAALDFPAEAEVTAAAVDVFDAPDETATAAGWLRKGDRVTVRDGDRAGWLTIDPPPGSFCWIEQSAIGVADGRSQARVITPGALLRSGHPQARMPGAVRVELAGGTVVRLLNRAPLMLGEGRDRRTWRAIAPPPGDVRHIRSAGVRIDREPRPEPTPAPGAEIRAGYVSPAGGAEAAVPAEVADAMARIESAHRAIVRQPVEQWRLEGVRQNYETLLRNVTDPASNHAIRERLDLVARHEELARDVRRIETVLQRSRRRDAALMLDQRRLVDAQKPQARPYDLEGLIQPSSRKVDGQKVFALIGRDGATEAYLDIPPGIDVRKLMTRRVGVRGTVHYNEALRARLISVRELEPLDPDLSR